MEKKLYQIFYASIAFLVLFFVSVHIFLDGLYRSQRIIQDVAKFNPENSPFVQRKQQQLSKQFSKITLVQLDAVPYDFFAPIPQNAESYQNQFTIVKEKLEKEKDNTILLSCISDTPQYTHLKLTELFSGFRTPLEIFSDNYSITRPDVDDIRQQMFYAHKRYQKIGPGQDYSADSIMTLDENFIKPYYDQFYKNRLSSDLNFIHFIEFDHTAHYFKQHRDYEGIRALKFYNQKLQNITDFMTDDEILIVFSDHGTGMGNGQHFGNEYRSMWNTFIYAYTKPGNKFVGRNDYFSDLFTENIDDGDQFFQQLDLGPTLSSLLQITIPFSNTANILLPLQKQQTDLQAQYIDMIMDVFQNTQQIFDAFSAFQNKYGDFSSSQVENNQDDIEHYQKKVVEIVDEYESKKENSEYKIEKKKIADLIKKMQNFSREMQQQMYSQQQINYRQMVVACVIFLASIIAFFSFLNSKFPVIFHLKTLTNQALSSQKFQLFLGLVFIFAYLTVYEMQYYRWFKGCPMTFLTYFLIGYVVFVYVWQKRDFPSLVSLLFFLSFMFVLKTQNEQDECMNETTTEFNWGYYTLSNSPSVQIYIPLLLYTAQILRIMRQIFKISPSSKKVKLLCLSLIIDGFLLYNNRFIGTSYSNIVNQIWLSAISIFIGAVITLRALKVEKVQGQWIYKIFILKFTVISVLLGHSSHRFFGIITILPSLSFLGTIMSKQSKIIASCYLTLLLFWFYKSTGGGVYTNSKIVDTSMFVTLNCDTASSFCGQFSIFSKLFICTFHFILCTPAFLQAQFTSRVEKKQEIIKENYNQRQKISKVLEYIQFFLALGLQISIFHLFYFGEFLVTDFSYYKMVFEHQFLFSGVYIYIYYTTALLFAIVLVIGITYFWNNFKQQNQKQFSNSQYKSNNNSLQLPQSDEELEELQEIQQQDDVEEQKSNQYHDEVDKFNINNL